MGDDVRRLGDGGPEGRKAGFEGIVGVTSRASGRSWALYLVTRGGDATTGPLLPPSPANHEGGPDRFAHYYAEDGQVLRMQTFLAIERSDGHRAAVLLQDRDAPSGTTWYLPATNLARLEHPHHAARRIARDWFVAAIPNPQFRAVLSFPGSGDAEDAWFVEFVYAVRLPAGHPMERAQNVAWVAPGEEPPGDTFVDQLSVWRRIPG